MLCANRAQVVSIEGFTLLGYIDLHTHILPGLDDGPADLDSAIALARDMSARGFDKVVATPHCFEGNPSPETIEKQLQLLTKELARCGVPLEILPGAEHTPDPYLVRRLQAGELLTLNGSRYILLELPALQPLPAYTAELIFELRVRGYHPVLAHPERVLAFQKNLSLLYGLAEKGAVIQLTLGSLAGYFGPESEQAALKIAAAGLAHLAATDAHRPGDRLAALPKAAALLDKLLGPGAAALLLRERPENLLAGRPLELPAVEPPAAKKIKKQPLFRRNR